MNDLIKDHLHNLWFVGASLESLRDTFGEGFFSGAIFHGSPFRTLPPTSKKTRRVPIRALAITVNDKNPTSSSRTGKATALATFPLYRLANGEETIIYDPVFNSVKKGDGRLIKLSTTENEIFGLLVHRHGEILSTADFRQVSNVYITGNSTKTKINRLRQKLHGKNDRRSTRTRTFILTKHDRGYTIPSSYVSQIPRGRDCACEFANPGERPQPKSALQAAQRTSFQ